jgi:hypothetical protein
LNTWVIARGAVLSAALLSGGAQAEQAALGVHPAAEPATQVNIPAPRQLKPHTGTSYEAPSDAQAKISPKLQIEAQNQSQSEGRAQAGAKLKPQNQESANTPLQNQKQQSTEIQVGGAPQAPNRSSSQAGTTSYPMKAPMEHEAPQAESHAQKNPYGRSSHSQTRQSQNSFATERREELEARAKELREHIEQYRSARGWWYAPWAEARRQWMDARHDYLREQSERRFEQFLAESNNLQNRINPLRGPGTWGPYGSQPWDPLPGPWGPYPW